MEIKQTNKTRAQSKRNLHKLVLNFSKFERSSTNENKNIYWAKCQRALIRIKYYSHQLLLLKDNIAPLIPKNDPRPNNQQRSKEIDEIVEKIEKELDKHSKIFKDVPLNYGKNSSSFDTEKYRIVKKTYLPEI